MTNLKNQAELPSEIFGAPITDQALIEFITVKVYAKPLNKRGLCELIMVEPNGKLPAEFRDLDYKYLHISPPITIGDEIDKAKIGIEQKGFYRMQYKFHVK